MSFGVSADASAALDRYDSRKPHAVGEIPSISFRHPEWDPEYSTFATDIRPPFQQRETWRFEITSKKRDPLVLAWTSGDGVPDNFQISLLDELRARVVDMRADSTYMFTPATDVSPFAVVVGTAEAVAEILAGALPQEFSLGGNFPNPFNPSTTIPVSVPVAADVELKIFSILGEEVRTLHSGNLERGRHWLTWDGRNHAGAVVAGGVYLCRMTTGNGKVLTRKMILLK
jgi:hypothetical protein